MAIVFHQTPGKAYHILPLPAFIIFASPFCLLSSLHRGHALAITQWQPELAFSQTEDLLNLSHPLTLPAMKRIWSEFLPWFQTREVHIGADEYNATLADDYIDFVNDLCDHIMVESRKKTRLWGTLEPSPSGKELNRERLIMQHWQ